MNQRQLFQDKDQTEGVCQICGQVTKLHREPDQWGCGEWVLACKCSEIRAYTVCELAEKQKARKSRKSSE